MDQRHGVRDSGKETESAEKKHCAMRSIAWRGLSRGRLTASKKDIYKEHAQRETHRKYKESSR